MAETGLGTAQSAGLAASLNTLLSAGNNLGAALSPVIVNAISGWFGPSARTKLLVAAISLMAVAILSEVWLKSEK